MIINKKMEKAQEIIDSVDKIKYPKKGNIKKSDVSEEEYLKKLCLEEKKKKPVISSLELSKKLGIDKEQIDKYFEEENERIKKEQENKKVVKVEVKEKPKKFLEILKKVFDKEDKDTSIEFLIKIILYGIPINFSLFVIFGISFNLYSWLGWGFAFWFIEKKVVDIIRGVWIR